MCSSLGRPVPHGYSYKSSIGASSGLLIMWDREEVEIFSSFYVDHVLAVSGRFVKSNENFVLFNVYAPCDAGSQSTLWGLLSTRLGNFCGYNICVCGDFNVVRGVQERQSSSTTTRLVGVSAFICFIDNNTLIDLPLVGHRFTWYRGDGHSMSRIDRFVLSENWCLRWPHCLQVAQLGGLSDHCLLVLSVDEQN